MFMYDQMCHNEQLEDYQLVVVYLPSKVMNETMVLMKGINILCISQIN